MYIFIFLFLFVIATFSFDREFLEKGIHIYIKKVLFVLSILLVILVGFRKVGIGVDDLNYFNMYREANQGYTPKDVSFSILARCLPNITLLFLAFASISIPLKTHFILRNVKYQGLVFLLYFSSSFILHDFVQIRAAVASGLFLWIIYYVGSERYMKAAIFLALAISFHLSSLVFLPIIFLKKKDSKLLYILFGVFSLFTLFIKPIDATSFDLFFPEIILKRLDMFLNETDRVANLINPITLIQYLITIIIFLNWDRLINFSNYSVYIIKSFLIGLYLFLILHNIPGISFRIYELLMIVQIPLADILIQTVKPKLVIVIIILILILLYFYYNFIKYPILNPYLLFFQ
jgi:hypothetical protein